MVQFTVSWLWRWIKPDLSGYTESQNTHWYNIHVIHQIPLHGHKIGVHVLYIAEESQTPYSFITQLIQWYVNNILEANSEKLIEDEELRVSSAE
jgi:hypothetical protein